MVLAKTQYKIHNDELWVIIEIFKTWCHYLESCKHKIFILIDLNNLYCFIDIKSLSSKQVCWAQKLSSYYFQIDYYQNKVNIVVDALSCFSQRS